MTISCRQDWATTRECAARSHWGSVKSLENRGELAQGLFARISGETDGASSCRGCSKPASASQPLISENVKVSP